MLRPVVGRLRVGHARPVVGDLEPQGPVGEPDPQLAAGPGVQEGVGDEFGHDDMGVVEQVAAAPLAAVVGEEPPGAGDVGRCWGPRSTAAVS